MMGDSLASAEFLIETLAHFPARPLPPNVDSGSNPYAYYNTSTIIARKLSQGGTNSTAGAAQYSLYGPAFWRVEAVSVLSITYGHNDYIHGRTTAQTYATILDLVATAQADGYKVVIETVLDAVDISNSWREDLNTLIRDGAVTYDYSVSDVASDATIGVAGAYSNTTYFSDGVHLTQAGNVIKGSYMYDVLYSLGFR